MPHARRNAGRWTRHGRILRRLELREGQPRVDEAFIQASPATR
jgi:hypothetical protein